MILITGAAGFIGSNLVAMFNEAGRDDLVLCDWLGKHGQWENLAKRSFVDIKLPEQLSAYLESPAAGGVEAVLHMGAISDTMVQDGDLVVERNYQFTKMLWTWCAARDVTLVYASSAATYGDGAQGFDDELDLVGLKCLRPLNLYGWSKHVFDLFALATPISAAPRRWYGLKFFNVFGPNEYHKEDMRSVVCKLAPGILAGEPSRLFKSHKDGFADGGQTRDFIHIDDVCAVVSHFTAGIAAPGLYNVGTGAARSFADLVSAAYRAAGHDPAIDYIPMPEALRARYQYFTEAKMEKLRASGYNRPFLSLEDGVSDYVKTYLTQEDRYR